jgi:hypothetical protein
MRADSIAPRVSASAGQHATTPSSGTSTKSPARRFDSVSHRHGDVDGAATNNNLYVGGLHDSVKDSDLFHRFKLFGTVVSAKIMLHIHTGASRGIGFVKFDNHDSALAALQALHRSILNGQRIMVRFADARADFNPGEKTTKVFVRNLPFDVTPPMLRKHFDRFGQIIHLTMHFDTAGFKAGGSGVRTRMAYVTFNTLEQAAAAAEQTHGTLPFASCDAPVMAKMAESDAKRQERRRQQQVAATPSGNDSQGSDDIGSDTVSPSAEDCSPPQRAASPREGRRIVKRCRMGQAKARTTVWQREPLLERRVFSRCELFRYAHVLVWIRQGTPRVE